MSDPFSTGTGIVGVLSLVIQITQAVAQFGIDWKDAPDNVRGFIYELGTLKTVLSETNTNILLDEDFAEAFRNRPSLLLSQLGPNSPATTDTKLMLDKCRKELECLLETLRKRERGSKLGLERLKAAFLAKDTRESVETLCRQCQILNTMISVDGTALGLSTYKEVREARKEQREWRQAEAKLSFAILDDLDQSNEHQETQKRQDERKMILEWLNPMDYASQQSDFIARRQEGTGEWLLESSKFQDWLRNSGQTLFCPGMPGAGKTVLTSIIVDYLCNNFQDNTTIGIAYLYCNFRQQAEQKAADLLASLLKQLSEQQSSLPDSIKSLYHNHRHKHTRPTVDDMSRVLQAVATLYSRIFIVIDALDECQVSDGSRSRFLTNVSSLQTRCRANLLVTSRFLPEISEGFKHAIALEIRASNEDVRRYLNGHMFRLPSFVVRSPELQEEVTIRIIQSVQGMFLLAQLHLESLIGKRSAKVLRNTLTTLPSGSEAYDHAYRDAMDRIEGQVKDQEQLAKQVLSWITCAKRPLTVLELQHALAVEVGMPNLDEENLPDIGDIVSTCAGLVTVDEESNIIRLVHYTTQEYFERTWTSWFPNAQSDITVTCVTYLLFHTFETGFCFTDKEFERRLHTNVLYDYAARYWGHHAREASTATKQLIQSFLESQAKLSASSQALMASKSYNGYSQRIPRILTPLHIAAYFGLKEITIYLLENGYDPNLQDTHGQTPLSWAARNGHEAVVKLLIGQDNIQADLKDSEHGQTPLSWATRNGHESVIKLLLESGKVDADSIDSGYGQTPLSWAARNGNVAFSKLLLNTGKVAVDSKDIEYGRTPLWWASRNGHEGIVRLLLETGKVDPDSKDNGYGRTPLWWAARNGHENIAKLLLRSSNVEINLKDSEFCQTPLSWAARNGHEAVVKILLKTSDNVEVDSKDNGYCQTPLSWAARNGHNGVVHLLLETNNVEADVKDKYSQTPLSWAAQNGHDVAIKLLLESRKVDINLRDTQYNRTPLSWAIRNKHEAVVELLLANDAEIESRGERPTTSIH